MGHNSIHNTGFAGEALGALVKDSEFLSSISEERLIKSREPQCFIGVVFCKWHKIWLRLHRSKEINEYLKSKVLDWTKSLKDTIT